MNDNQWVQSLYWDGIYHYTSQAQPLYLRYDSGCACPETWLPVLMLLHDLRTFFQTHTANKSRKLPHGEGSSGRTWSTSNNGQGQPIHPSCFLLFHQVTRSFRSRKSQGPHCGKEACRRVVDALCGDAELALRPGQRLWNSSLPTYGHNAGRE